MGKEKATTLRGYAKLKGVSPPAVQKAIDTGKLKNSVFKQRNGSYHIDIEKADEEWASNFNISLSRSPKLVEAVLAESAIISDVIDDDISLSTEAEEKAKYGEVLRLKTLVDLQHSRLKLAEAQGLLIPKDAVDKQLAEFGSEIRISLEAIPDRVVDEVMAAKTRQEAYNIITREISETLLKLTQWAVEPLKE